MPGDRFTSPDGLQEVRVDAVERGQVYYVRWLPGEEDGYPHRKTLENWRESCANDSAIYKAPK
jgi:hypothetical protein